jgi:hypothetical protein
MIEYVAIPVTGSAILLSCWLLYRNFRLKSQRYEALRAKVDADFRAEVAINKANNQVEQILAKRMKEFTAKFDVDNAHMLSQALVGTTFNSLHSSIKELIEQKFNRVSQEFVGNLTDEADTVIRELNIDLCEKIWDSFQGYKELSKESPYIFPDGTKIAYTKGNRTVVVIEQKPQVRTVTFDGELLTRSQSQQAQSVTESGYRYTLSFPYVYFVIVFDKSKYTCHEMYFRNKPLSSVREHIYLAPLPNVFRNTESTSRAVCMGGDFKNAVKEELTIARQCEMVIADFWLRAFNNDLGDGEPENVDRRIRNYAVWQQNTASDPMFILSVNWTKGKTIKGVVEAMLDGRNQNHKLDPVDKVIRDQLEAGVRKLTERIKMEIQNAKTKGLQGADIDHHAATILEDVVKGHAKRVFEKCSK